MANKDKSQLTPWGGSLFSLHNDLNSLFDDFIRPTSSIMQNSRHLMNTAPLDIIEGKDSYKVRAELPGMSKDDIHIDIDNGKLIIEGEKKTESEEKGEDFITRERSFGSIRRVITLPDTADTDKAKATFEKGILKITLPKRAEAINKAKRLQIEAKD